ncbi:site-specific DNA-methyltransferase [Bittarella massiliensis (ex Durand et al. 2017)]|uniref:Site-specific DNA-methyltransferase n=1 Tax=Bittarella massiliensis (ex Durand et al. 2017) TaxID=1720313 RepID=A0AAW5KHD5_9FIRM|nr:site-specific DNA-methyltransferase [Bittarella massiliensis (ex Durand et al. 2017)]MCQ4950414.1 site-specific DNA-methyltransferase [Bittarella massiliensis (ex Durand et al. 2017)]
MADKLELRWSGKDEPPHIEPRLLIENPALSNAAADPQTENMLIHGDNLLALKALEGQCAGRVKCIYIDPPYNTGSAFAHYSDHLGHSQWLQLMYTRLNILQALLSDDGSIWISIDDDEGHYLKVLCDEVFGRNNFVSTVVWEKKYTVANDAKWLSDNHDFILVYAKNKEIWRPNRLPRTAAMNRAYKNPDHHPKGVWKSTPLHAKSGSLGGAAFSYTFQNGVVYTPPPGTFPRYSAESLRRMDENGEIWFGKDGTSIPSRKTFLCDLKRQGVPSKTIWHFDEVGHNHEARREVKQFNPEEVFATPKPERLVERILLLASDPGDLVLDSFLGSGTTAAVAHKMGRRYIGIEMGDHAYTHCKARLDAVVAGTDRGGVTEAVGWQGGGGYRFYELAPPLLNRDACGEPVIGGAYRAEMLAAAVALREGYTYRPDGTLFWKQSFRGEGSYLFATTRHLTAALLASIGETMGEGERLVIASPSFDGGLDGTRFRIAVKEIPQELLERCALATGGDTPHIVHPPVCGAAGE